MKNVKAPIIIILLLLLAGLAFLAVRRQKLGTTVHNQKITIDTLTQDLALTKSALNSAQSTNATLTASNNQLTEEKAALTSKVTKLSKEVKALKAQIKDQRTRLDEALAKIKDKEAQIAELQSQISGLNAKNKSDAAKIKQLEEQTKALSSGISDLAASRDSIVWIKDELSNELLDKEEAEENVLKQLSMINDTEIIFQVVKPLKDRNGKSINKIKNKNWNYTELEFSMYHPQDGFLAGEEFSLQIVDKDSGKVVPLREVNPQFPDSDQNAFTVPFSFDSNPIKLEHFNSEDKKSKNYEVQILYKVKDEEWLIRSGSYLVVANDRVNAIGN